MPVSPSQHRASAGNYNSKRHDNFNENFPQTQRICANSSAIPNEVRQFGVSIYTAANSHEELNRPSCQDTAPRQRTVAPLLMLLSQVRFADSVLPARTNTPALVFGREVSPSVAGETAHLNSGRDGFSTMLSPIANALYGAGQFISQYDPLKFPATDALPMPHGETEITMAPSIHRDFISGSYIITDEHRQNELISSLVQYMVSNSQLTSDEGKDFELWLRSEATGMPMLVAPIDDNEGSTSTRPKRALVADKDPRTAEHIKDNCAFEEEVLDAQGEHEGKLLLFQAQRAENPFRMFYDNNPNARPSPEERGAADGLNIVADILTLGIKPLIGKLIANAKRQKYYQSQGDEICAERFRRLFIAEWATSLDVAGLPLAPRKVKPSVLLHASPERQRAAFYTFNTNSHIRTEILLELKQGKGSITDIGRKIYLKPTKKPNEFITYHPDAVKAELLERRVIVDESNLSWRYADSFDSSNLNVDISEGKRQIKLHGDQYELQLNNAGQYEIVVNKESGVKEYIPVYMEPLSRTWHLSIHDEQPIFTNKHTNIIKETKAHNEEGFYYIPRANNNTKYYGAGIIYVHKKIGDVSNFPWGRYIEMNGELVPVRNTQHQGAGVLYEIYNVKTPDKKGHPVEWDGERWLFEQETSAHVSVELEKQITPEMFSKGIDISKLSAPDHKGLRVDANEDSYIKISNKFVKIEGHEHLFSIRSDNGEKIAIGFKEGKFIPSKLRVTDRFDARNLASIDISKLNIHSIPEHQNLYVTSNGSLYIKIKNIHYPIEFFGKDKRVVLIGSPNEIRFACIYNPKNGSVKNIGEYLGQSTLTYNKDLDIYTGVNLITEKISFMKFDKVKDNLIDTYITSITKINETLNKVGFKKFDVYITTHPSKDVYLAAHAARDITLSRQIPDNFELKFYTKKGKTLNGRVDDLQDLVHGKFNAAQTKKGGEIVEDYVITFDYDSQINYAKLAMESNKNIIKIKEGEEARLKNLLRDLSYFYNEDKTIHLYMCRSF